MMKRTLAVSLISSMLIGMLAGCGATTESAETAEVTNSVETTEEVKEETVETEEEEIVLSFIMVGNNETTKEAYLTLFEKYHEENPNVTIEYQDVSFSDGDTKLNALYASGAIPDIVRAPISTIAERASMGQYAVLDDYIAEWDEKDNYMENAYEIGSYDGKVYGLPIQMDPQFLFYRKDYFEEAGLDPEAPPTTWEELLEYSEALVVREGDDVMRAGFSFPISEEIQTFQAFARQNGAELVDMESNLPNLNAEEVIESLDYLAQYAENNLVIPYIRNKDEQPFMQGNAAMCNLTLVDYVALQASEVDWIDEVGFSAALGNEEISFFGGAQITFISEDSKYKDEAWKVMEFLYDDENMWYFIEQTGATPVKLSLADEFDEKYPVVGEVFLESLEYAEGNPKVEWFSIYSSAFATATEEVMYGIKDAATALEDAQNQILLEIQ